MFRRFAREAGRNRSGLFHLDPLLRCDGLGLLRRDHRQHSLVEARLDPALIDLVGETHGAEAGLLGAMSALLSKIAALSGAASCRGITTSGYIGIPRRKCRIRRGSQRAAWVPGAHLEPTPRKNKWGRIIRSVPIECLVPSIAPGGTELSAWNHGQRQGPWTAEARARRLSLELSLVCTCLGVDVANSSFVSQLGARLAPMHPAQRRNDAVKLV